MTDRTCTVDGCEKPHFGKGWCGMHYQRMRCHGSLDDPRTNRIPRVLPECSIEGCDKPGRKRGWCHMHYRRWRLTGGVGSSRPLINRDHEPTCSIEGCTEPYCANGYCSVHNARIKRHGTHEEQRPWLLAPDGQRWCGRCKTYKVTSQFYKDSRRSDGLYLLCIQCCRAKVAMWRKTSDKYAASRKANDRKVRLRGRPRESFTRIEIAERDGWVCQRCGKRIDRRLKWPHPRSFTIDHIIPVSKGGDHTRVNVQAAHADCNNKKKNGGMDQLRLIG